MGGNPEGGGHFRHKSVTVYHQTATKPGLCGNRFLCYTQDMIDWYNIAANAVWIFACAGALAVISAALFHSRTTRNSLGTTLQQSPYPVLLDLAGCVFCLGQAAV